MSIDKLKTKFSTGAWLTDVKHYFKKINEIVDWINDIGSTAVPNYKIYIALLTQTGTNAPVATVLKNTLNGDIIWTRNEIGDYIGTLNNTFNLEKTFVQLGGIANGTDIQGQIYRSSNNDIGIFTYNTVLSDNILYYTSIEIRVYN